MTNEPIEMVVTRHKWAHVIDSVSEFDQLFKLNLEISYLRQEILNDFQLANEVGQLNCRQGQVFFCRLLSSTLDFLSLVFIKLLKLYEPPF